MKPHSSVEHTLQRCNNRAKSMIRKLLTANKNGFTGISVSTTHTHTHKKQSKKWLKVGFRLWVQLSNLVRLRLSSFDKVSMKFVLFYSPFLNWPSEESHQRHTHTLNSVGTEHNKTGSVLQCSFRKGPFSVQNNIEFSERNRWAAGWCEGRSMTMEPHVKMQIFQVQRKESNHANDVPLKHLGM